MQTSYQYIVYQIKYCRKVDEKSSAAFPVYDHYIAPHKNYECLYGKLLNKNPLPKQLVRLKKQEQYRGWNRFSPESIQRIVEKTEVEYRKFFRRRAPRQSGFPSKKKYHSVTVKNKGWPLNGNEFVINSIGLGLRFFKFRELDGKIKTITWKRDAAGGLWRTLSWNIGQSQTQSKARTGQTAGFDFGLKTFLTGSDRTVCDSARFIGGSMSTLVPLVLKRVMIFFKPCIS